MGPRERLISNADRKEVLELINEAREAKQTAKRKAVRTQTSRPLAPHVATEANQVWTWDITRLPGAIKGLYYKLYLIIDIFSRIIIQWEIHETETQVHAMELEKKVATAKTC